VKSPGCANTTGFRACVKTWAFITAKRLRPPAQRCRAFCGNVGKGRFKMTNPIGVASLFSRPWTPRYCGATPMGLDGICRSIPNVAAPFAATFGRGRFKMTNPIGVASLFSKPWIPGATTLLWRNPPTGWTALAAQFPTLPQTARQRWAGGRNRFAL
jgi:hypothetical protein